MSEKPTYEELEERVKELEREASKLKQPEEALHRITDEQSILLSTVPAMIFWIDKEGTFVRVNDTFAAALHTSADDIKGKSLFDLYPEDMARAYYNDNVKVMESGAPKRGIEEPIETPTDTIWVSTDKIPHRDEKGDIIGIIGFSENITARKQAEESLRESKEKLAGIIASVSDHMSMMDEEHNIVWANDVAKRLFGPDIIGKKCYSTYHRLNEVCQPCIVEKTFADGKVHEHETEVIGADGKKMIFWCKASVATLHEDGRPKLVVEISRDITIRKRTEKALRESMEKYRSIIEGIEELLWG